MTISFKDSTASLASFRLSFLLHPKVLRDKMAFEMSTCLVLFATHCDLTFELWQFLKKYPECGRREQWGLEREAEVRLPG